MIGVVIVAHGGLAREYLLAVEHVVGKQSDMQAISIEDDCDRDKKQAEICAAANAVDHGEGVVVVTDMFGGSPSNLSLPACATSGRRILYGANLPMLIKLASVRASKPLDIAGAEPGQVGKQDDHPVRALRHDMRQGRLQRRIEPASRIAQQRQVFGSTEAGSSKFGFYPNSAERRRRMDI